jgi:glutamyl-tRNA reductase
VVLDLGVPRNVEPAARGLGGIRLFNLDDLQELCCPAGHPSIAVAEAQRILNEEMRRLQGTIRARSAGSRLAELHRVGLILAHQEARRALALIDGLSDGERQIIHDMAERLVRRVLYPVSRRLRDALVEGPANGKRTA